MRHLVPLLAACCLCPLGAAEAPPDPATAIGADAVLMARMGDLRRALERLPSTPFAQLQETPWGKLARTGLATAIAEAGSAKGIDAAAAAASIRGLAFGVHMTNVAPVQPWAQIGVVVDDAAPLTAALAPFFTNQLAEPEPLPPARSGMSGALQWRDKLCVYTSPNAPSLAAKQAPAFAAASWPAVDQSADLELTYRSDAALRALAAAGQPVPAKTFHPTITCGLRLDRIGMREHDEIAYPPEESAQLRTVPWKPANLALLASLPPTTLCALVTRCDSASMRRLIEMQGSGLDDQTLARIDMALKAKGLPPLTELATRFDGDALVYLEEAAPFPAATAVLEVDPEVGGKLLEALRAQLHGAAGEALLGMIGPVTCYGEQRGRQLIITTNPGGIDAVAKRPAGFTGVAEVKEALAEIRPDALLAGVSRSGATWGTLAQLAVIPLSMFGKPELMTIPQDLRKAGRFGFVSCSPTAKGFSVDGGGLLGGPFGLCALGGLAGAMMIPNAGASGAVQVNLGEPKEPESVKTY